MRSSSSAFVVASSIAVLLGSAVAQRWEPLPACWTCVSRSRILSPAIGIDIEPSYLTAAIRFHNGTVLNLAKVDGSLAYQDLMRAMAIREVDISEGHSSPQTYLQMQPNQHTLEVPSEHTWSESVKIIGTALAALKAVVEPLLLNQPLPSVLPAYPNFPGLQWRMVQEAMEYANIAMLGEQRVAPVGAVAAANGIGLCENFIDLDACEDEEVGLPMTRMLAIEYAKVALTVTLSPFRTSRKSYDWTIERAWDLGADARPESPDTEGIRLYWQRVRAGIQKIPARIPADRPITHVVVMGESALDETFLTVMSDALRDVLDVRSMGIYETHMVDPTFAAARGAAEFGKRMMESPDGCVEGSICKWWRRRLE